MGPSTIKRTCPAVPLPPNGIGPAPAGAGRPVGHCTGADGGGTGAAAVAAAAVAVALAVSSVLLEAATDGAGGAPRALRHPSSSAGVVILQPIVATMNKRAWRKVGNEREAPAACSGGGTSP